MSESPSQTGHFKNQFTPEMPRIPGVNEPTRERHVWERPEILKWLALAVVVVGGIVWSGVHAARYRAASTLAMKGRAPAQSGTAAPTTFPAPLPVTRKDTAAATVADLASPWSAKEFDFFNPLTHAYVPAMIIRLPGSAGKASGYWAFSLDAPYGTCRLTYVTDLRELASHYHYRARHPMVVAACDGTIYDPLQLGTTPDGAWVRGDVAQGAGSRPPLAINVRVQGQAIVADRME